MKYLTPILLGVVMLLVGCTPKIIYVDKPYGVFQDKYVYELIQTPPPPNPEIYVRSNRNEKESLLMQYINALLKAISIKNLQLQAGKEFEDSMRLEIENLVKSTP